MGNSGSAHNIHSERSAIDRNSHFQTRFQHQSQKSHRQFEWSRSSGLRSSPLNHQRSLTTEWRRSYPSTLIKKESSPQIESGLKVLPELDKRLHLRATTNGAILNSGGTISGRKQTEIQSQNISSLLGQRSQTFLLEPIHDRSSNLSRKHDTKPEFTRSQTLLHIKAKIKDADSNLNESNLSRMQRHTYSEPELINDLKRQPAVTKNTIDSSSRPNNRSKYSKKRRAPEAPQILTAATPQTARDNNPNTKENIKSMHYAKNSDRKLSKQPAKPAPIQTDSLKRDHAIRKSVNENSGQNQLNDCPRIGFRREKSSDAILLRSRRTEQIDSNKTQLQREHPQSSNRNSVSKPEGKPTKDKLDNGITSAVQANRCQRTFYFGMETDAPRGADNPSDMTDDKLSNIDVSLPVTDNYELAYRENTDVEESLNDNGLLVRIRPTLPRRQLDTPSFSPTMAWLSLAEQQEHIDKSKILNTVSNCYPVSSETPIQPNRTSQIKQLARPNPMPTNWTPEQDLVDDHDDKIKGLITGDDSSSDEYRSKCEGDGLLFYGSSAKNLSSPVHTFSLSLPRDSHTQHSRNIGNLNDVCNYMSLQKSKLENYLNVGPTSSSSHQRSSTGHGQTDNICVSSFECSNNWMLHKNVSGAEPYTKSLEHGSKRQRLVPMEPQSIKYLTGGKHVMYLPGSNDQANSLKVYQSEPQDNLPETKTNRNFKTRQRNIPQSLQDKTPIFPIKSLNEEGLKLEDEKPFHQRFLFNNPVRLLEKKLHVEKSGKSAKLKMSIDGQLEALKKVEEDFQRNRANEKENIQHQLRLYFGAEDEQFHSLPLAPVLDRFSAINLNDTNNTLACRDDPEGCVSSVPYSSHESKDHKVTVSSKNIFT